MTRLEFAGNRGIDKQLLSDMQLLQVNRLNFPTACG